MDVMKFFSLISEGRAYLRERKIAMLERMAKQAIQHDYTNYFLLYIFPSVGLALGLVIIGLAPLSLALGFYNYFIYNQIHRTRDYLIRKQNFLKDTEHLSPPTFGHPNTKTDIQTYNHIFSFVLDNGIVWYATRNKCDEKPDWQRLFVDTLHERKIISIKADGENLMARVGLDKQQDEVYYKKVLTEKWKSDKLEVTSLMDEPEDIPSWFKLPFLRYLYPNDYHKRLKISTSALWAMSHAGKFKLFVLDRAGHKHDVWGITSVYEQQGAYLAIYDPYVPLSFNFKIPLPANFELRHLDVSSSMIVLLGKERQGDHLVNALYLGRFDYDLGGLHPLMSYSYDPKDTKKRTLPMSSWQKIEMCDTGEPHYVNISQTGQGDLAAEVSIIQANGRIVFKKLDENRWQTHQDQATSMVNISQSFAQPRPQSLFEGKNASIGGNHFAGIRLVDYDADSLMITVIATCIKGNEYRFALCKEYNIIRQQLGLSFQQYKMISFDSRIPMPAIEVTIEQEADKFLIKSAEGEGINIKLEQIHTFDQEQTRANTTLIQHHRSKNKAANLVTPDEKKLSSSTKNKLVI